MSALPRTAHAGTDTDTGIDTASTAAELRVLSGCHAGARVRMDSTLHLGTGDECDIILSDLDLPDGIASVRLQRVGERWCVTSAQAETSRTDAFAASSNHQAANDSSGDPANTLVPLAPWGQVGTVGGLTITVSTPQAAWQSPQNGRTGQAPDKKSTKKSPQTETRDRVQPPSVQSVAPPAERTDTVATSDSIAITTATPSTPLARPTSATAATRAPSSATAQRNTSRTTALAIGLALVLLAAGGLWWLWPDSAPATEATPATALVVDAARQQQLLRDVQQALASVDPSLRLLVEPLPDGRARVSGWVQGVEQLDRVAEALSAVRPLPVLGVRTAADLLDDLRAATSASAAPLGFDMLGAGRIRVTGTLQTTDEQNQALAQLRSRVPAGIDIIDGLRVAQNQGPAVQEWLRKAGFEGAETRWDTEASQLVVEVDIATTQRPALENLLARPGHPLAGLPFRLRVRESARPDPAAPVHASAAPLPFRIRGVVGGAAPYVVLGDGTKLQPGGQRAGWRLVQIEPERLLFDGPRRMVLLR